MASLSSSLPLSGPSPSLYTRPPPEDYFSIDDILASQHKVPCKFELPVYRLGFLDRNSSSEHLDVGAKLELPLWLARVLSSRRRQIVSTELPRVYSEQQRNVLRADANVVDLYKAGPFFYSVGVKLLSFEHAEQRALSRCLLEAFLNRFRRIMDLSQNAFRVDTSSLTARLDESERLLFATGQRSLAAMEAWERGESHRLVTVPALRDSRKRRREEE